MHAHLDFKLELGLRAQMEKGGMLAVAEKITPDAPLIQRLRDKLGITRQARPGEMRRIYSHGHVSAGLPAYSQDGSTARAVHLPMAKAIAAKGGVIGFWPDWYTYASLALMADALARAAGEIGAAHIGIGSDLHGLLRTVMPSYVEFAALEEALAKRGMKGPEIEGILGGNYLRVLREAMKT